MSVDFNLTQVSENTVMGSHEAGHSNAGAVMLDNFIVAIDCTMWPHTARLFRKALEEKFRKPVKYLFVTHSHGDHVMGLTAYKDITIFGCDHYKTAFYTACKPNGHRNKWQKGRLPTRTMLILLMKLNLLFHHYYFMIP